MRQFVLGVSIASLSVSSMFAQIEYHSNWPRIQELKITITIDTLADRIHQTVSIYQKGGSILYTLSCIGGSTDYLDSLSNATGSNFVGPLCFFLTSVDSTDMEHGGFDWNLLCEDGTASWYSRGQIHDYAELRGTCGKYPEFGILRHFRLRGFELTLRFSDVSVGKDARSPKLNVEMSVLADSTVTSSIAEQSGFLPPDSSGLGCENIVKGRHASMWRSKDGKWIELK